MRRIFVIIKAPMCNILTTRKSNFTCKGLFANCSRKTTSNGDQPIKKLEEINLIVFLNASLDMSPATMQRSPYYPIVQDLNKEFLYY